ncbi:hypothetical protein KUTeg_024726 [Tegillarca granosa]|uniref:Globin domain-containing protein n=1 Tax=Tegillarca granosa TaxID=220873 RepID=A0ABQ9E3W0_TEGGR|nr:hypothetical protein KUTeg_024726 [Tegillarca granosa]
MQTRRTKATKMVDAAVANVCGSDAIKANLRRSWGMLSADIESTGLMLMGNTITSMNFILYLSLFALRPDTKSYFTRLGDVQKGKGNSKLRGHAITLTYALNNFVDSLDDPSRLKCVAINEPMKETLKARMGSYYSDECAAAWAALVAVVQAAL